MSYRVGQAVEVMRDGVRLSHVILHAKRSLTSSVLLLVAIVGGIFAAFFVLGRLTGVTYREWMRTR